MQQEIVFSSDLLTASTIDEFEILEFGFGYHSMIRTHDSYKYKK